MTKKTVVKGKKSGEEEKDENHSTCIIGNSKIRAISLFALKLVALYELWTIYDMLCMMWKIKINSNTVHIPCTYRKWEITLHHIKIITANAISLQKPIMMSIPLP